MASSTAFNVSNGATNPSSRHSGDTQPETGSVPLENPSRVHGGSTVPSSIQHSNGIFVPLVPLPQVSPTNLYAEREFSMELYQRVSAHVVRMQEHPYEKTLKYKVSRVRIVCRGYFARFKARLWRKLRVFSASVARHIGRYWGYFTAFFEAVAYRCHVALRRVSFGCVKQALL